MSPSVSPRPRPSRPDHPRSWLRRIGEQQHFLPLLPPFPTSPLPPPGHESRRPASAGSRPQPPSFPLGTNRGGSTFQRRHTTLKRSSPAFHVQRGGRFGSRDEGAARAETTPGSQKAHPPRLPGHGHHGFDTASSQSEQTGSTNFREGSSGNSSISCLSPWARITEVRRFNVATRRRTVFLPCFAHEEGSHSRPALPTVLVSSCSTRTWRRGRGSATSAILLGDEHLPVRRSSVRIRDCPATVRWARGPRVRSPCPARH